MANGEDLQGQVALVTGGGRGIGRKTAVELAGAGMKVAVSARSKDEIEEAIEAAMDGHAQAKKLRDTLDTLELDIKEYKRKGFRDDYLSVEGTREQANLVRSQLARLRKTVAARVRKRAKASGSTISALVAEALTEFLARGHRKRPPG